MSDTQKKIGIILEQRRIRLPQVQQDIERWTCLDQLIGTLKISVDELPNLGEWHDLKQALAEFRSEDIRKDIAKTIELLRVLEARYSRKTINIGVSGRARVGKSTLLQAISGLEDEQIPTGSGIPVTAQYAAEFSTRPPSNALPSRCIPFRRFSTKSCALTMMNSA